MRLAAIQMVSTPEVHANLKAADALIASSAAAGAQLVCLPEYFCLMGRRDTDKLAIAEPSGHGQIQEFLSEQARRHGLWIVGGTLPLSLGDRADRVTNSCLVYDPRGACVARYDKIHLFAFERGGERYDESRVLQAGQRLTRFEADGYGVGLGVCYDLRFPELFRGLGRTSGRGASRKACDLICVPSAFTWTTGQAHWEILLRARAIENQCYVLASAQGGRHENGRQTWGHSMIIDPWGEVMVRHESGEGFALADLDDARLQEVRSQLPALSHERHDLFPAPTVQS